MYKNNKIIKLIEVHDIQVVRWLKLIQFDIVSILKFNFFLNLTHNIVLANILVCVYIFLLDKQMKDMTI